MRNGFTLIELVVVVIIISVLASLATLSLGGTMDRYRMNRAVETFERFDARARRDARTTRQGVQATISRATGHLSIDTVGQERDARYRLPNKIQIGEIRMQRLLAVGSRFEIDFDRQGHCPSYAIELKRGSQSRWLIVLGLSGQVIHAGSEGEVDEILSL